MSSFVLADWLQQGVEADNEPVYQRLYALCCKAILDGNIPSGARLPSTRELAAELGVARNTILQVYSQLEDEGYVSAGVGRGTYVRDLGPQKRPVDERVTDGSTLPGLTARDSFVRPHGLSRRGQQLVDGMGFSNLQTGAFLPGVPDVREFPVKAWARIQNRLWREGSWDLMRYAPAGGYGPLRQSVSDYLGSARSVRCTAQQIVMTSGIHQAVDVAARLLCDPGDTVWIEEPTYWGLRTVLTLAGLRVVPVPVDDEGLWPGGLDDEPPPRLIVVAPSHQYPLGMVMSLARRRMLLDYARKVSCWIFEDDYDSEFRYSNRPLPSLQGMDDTGRVLYAGSFSKILSPGLRVGYIAVPEPLAEAFADAVAELYREGNMMTHAVLDECIRSDVLGAHVRRVRRRYAERRDCLIEEIHRHFGHTLNVVGSDAGLHLILSLPDTVDDEVVVRDALRQGVITRPVSTYYLERARARPGLLLGFAGVTPDEIRSAFDTLARVIGRYL